MTKPKAKQAQIGRKRVDPRAFKADLTKRMNDALTAEAPEDMGIDWTEIGSDSGARFAQIDLTKETAQRLIHLIPEVQRPKILASVAALLEDADSGRWELSQDCLVIEVPDGSDLDDLDSLEPTALLNGQHRVIVRCLADGRRGPFPAGVLFVTEKNAASVFGVLDQGAKRRLQDQLRQDGVRNITGIAGLIRGIALYRQIGSITGGTASFSTAMAIYHSSDDEHMQEVVTFSNRISAQTNVPAGIIALHVWLVEELLAELGEDAESADLDPRLFWEYVADRSMFTEGTHGKNEATVKLADIASQTWRSQRRPSRRIVWNYVLKAWHKHLGGERVGNLRWVASEGDLDLLPPHLMPEG